MSFIIFVTCVILSFAQTGIDNPSTKAHCKATFELEVKRSDVMKPGKHKLICMTAFAEEMRREGRGHFSGIDIFFAPKTAGGHVPKTPGELKKGEYATVNLMLDKTNRLTQVNMTVVVPGSTVARTVAWKAEDLKKYFSNVDIKGKQVILKSEGTYEDAESESERAILHWDVDVNVSVTSDSGR